MKKLTEILFFNPFRDYLMGGSSLSISIEKGAFTLCYLRKSITDLGVKFYREFPVSDSYPNPSEVVSTSKVVLSEGGIDVRDIILSVPREWVLIKVVELPLSVEENLTDVIAYEMDRYTPFNTDQVFYDYAVLQRSESVLKVVLYVIKKDKLIPYIERAKEGGFNIRQVTFNPAAEAFLYGLSRPDRSALIIKPGSDYMTLILTRSCYPVSVERLMFSEKEVSLDRVAEVAREGVHGIRPEEIVIDSHEKEGTKILEDQIPLPVTSFSALRVGRLSIDNNSVDRSSVGASASGIFYKANPVNLLSKGRREKEKRPIGLTLFLLAILLILMVLNAVLPVLNEKKEVNALTERINALRADVKAVDSRMRETERLVKNINSIRQFKASAPVMLEILKEITKLLPDNTWLTRLKVTDKDVIFEGYSDSATGLISILESSTFLKNVSFSSPTVKDRRLNKERFRIKAEIERKVRTDEKE